MLALLAWRNPRWQKVALLPPLVFAVMDLIENALLLAIVLGYPSLSSPLVRATSLITQVKRVAFYTSALELLLSLLIVVALWVRRKPTLSGVG